MPLLLPLLFAVTLFVSAFLLFLVQPMIGKMVLPLLGGTPAVWNTCMVFFQAALLAGYFYTHSVSTYLPVRRQLFLQGAVLLLPLLFVPFTIGSWTPPTESNPVFDVLLLLGFVVGVPFFVVATSAPLLQKWFASTGHPSAKDPYFLYGASNLGSMLALVAYPFVVEPNFSLDGQTILWAVVYGVFVVLTAACGAVVWLARPAPVRQDAITVLDRAKAPALATAAVAAGPPPGGTAVPEETAIRAGRRGVRARKAAQAPVAAAPRPEVTPLRRLRWVALAAVPSSLMLGVTTYLTTDIAAIPLFWVVPLALYLLTFILVFMRWPVEWTGTPHTVAVVAQPAVLAVLAIVIAGDVSFPQWFAFLINLLAFFITALVCHGELARDRPSTQHLTEFYLCMSLGGVLGGMFNALLAPVVFNRIFEYALVLAFACLLRPPTNFFARLRGREVKEEGDPTTEDRVLDVGYAVCLGLLAYALLRLSVAENIWGQSRYFWFWAASQVEGWLPATPGAKENTAWQTAQAVGLWVSTLVVVGIPLAICLVFSGRPLRFGLCALALFLATGLYNAVHDEDVYVHRSFFGVQRVRIDVQENRKELDEQGHPGKVYRYHTLIHGGIDHGRQLLSDSVEARHQPITYFHPTGGVGQVFAAFNEQQEAKPFGVIGLGIGTLASFGRKGQIVDFYEIDPAVKRLSLPEEGEPRYFHYLHDAQTVKEAKVRVILGDGRLKLKEAPNGMYQILVVDAFSSDAIPVHLLTLEAIDLYMSKLADGGLLIFNVTNRYVELEPILGDLAAKRGLLCLHWGDFPDGHFMKFSSEWVLMVKRRQGPKAMAAEAMHLFGAVPAVGGPGAVPWATLSRAPQMDIPPLLLQLSWNLNRRTHADRIRDLRESSKAWRPVRRLGGRPWTDDYTNLLSVLSW